MKVFYSLLLLAIAGGLNYAGAQESYSVLSKSYKEGVDLALQHLNSRPDGRQLLLFYKSLMQSDVDVSFGLHYYYHNFFLRATTCSKRTANPDPSKCPFRNDRPLLDCVACYNTFDGKIEHSPKPYIHCTHKPSLTNEIKKKREDHCNGMNHFSGGGTLLAQKGH